MRLRRVIDTRFWIAAVCVAFVAGVPSTGVAGQAPRTDAVAGSFTFNTVQVSQRTCAGQDGPYLDLDVVQVGSAAGDARISGDLDLTSHILLNAGTGVGTSEGRFTVRDATTGRRKAAGEFHGVITPASAVTFALKGILIGEVNAGDAGGRVLANFDAVFDINLNGTGTYGGPGSAVNPAVIQDGHCGGPVTRIP